MTQPVPVEAMLLQTPSEVEPIRPPNDEASFQSIDAEVAGEMERLQAWAERAKEIDPTATAPTPEIQRAIAAKELVESYTRYLTQLRDFKALREQVRLLEDAQSSAQFAEEIRLRQERVDDARKQSRMPPHVVTDDELKAAEQELETATSDLGAQRTTHDDRTKRLADLGVRKESLAAEVQRKKTALLETAATFDSKQAAAVSDIEKDIITLALKSLRLGASEDLLRQEAASLESLVDTVQSGQAEDRIAQLQELVAQLRGRVDKLKQIRTASEAEKIRGMAEWAEQDPGMSGYERSYWRQRANMISGLESLGTMRANAGLNDLFTEESLADLTRDLAAELANWKQFMDSIERRPSDQIRQRYRQIGARIRHWESERNKLRLKLDTTFDERANFEPRISALEDLVREQGSQLRNLAAADSANPRVAELRQQMAVARQQFDVELVTFHDQLHKLSDRLLTAIKTISDHIDALSVFPTKLNVAYLLVREDRLWEFRLSKSINEWNAPEASENRERDRKTVYNALDSVTAGQWVSLAGKILAALMLALYVRRRMLAAAEKLEKRIEQRIAAEGTTIASVSDRLHFQGLRFLGRKAPLVWTSTAAILAIRATPMDGRLVTAACLFLIFVGLVDGLIATAFSFARPRFKLLPCSQVVARYYRRWLRLLFWISVFLVPIPLFLTLRDWAPYTRSHIWSAYQALALVIALLFGSRKDTVLKLVGRPEAMRERFLLALVSSAYPLFYLIVAGLLIVHLSGYGAATTYAITASMQSIGVIILSSLALHYLGDISKRFGNRLMDIDEKEGQTAPTVKPNREAALAAGKEVALIEPPLSTEATDTPLVIVLVLIVLRFAVWGFAIFLVLRSWGVSWLELRGWMDTAIVAGNPKSDLPPITIGRALLAITLVLASWLVARTVRVVLQGRIAQAPELLDRGGWIAVGTLVQYLIVLFGFYFSLQIMRIPIGALTVVLGTVGLGLGLGLQPVFANFFSGLVMLFERHLRVGDLVEVDGVLGEVTNISIRATTILTYDNVDMIIPNGDFITKTVVNWTLKDERVRGRIMVGVAYGTDPRLVQKLLLQVATENPMVLAYPPPKVRFDNFGDSALEFELLAWFRRNDDRWDFNTECRFRIIELFEQHGVQIPFPHRTLQIAPDAPIRVRIEGTEARAPDAWSQQAKSPND